MQENLLLSTFCTPGNLEREREREKNFLCFPSEPALSQATTITQTLASFVPALRSVAHLPYLSSIRTPCPGAIPCSLALSWCFAPTCWEHMAGQEEPLLKGQLSKPGAQTFLTHRPLPSLPGEVVTDTPIRSPALALLAPQLVFFFF